MRATCQPTGDADFTVDTEHARPKVDASSLTVDRDEAALAGTGTHLPAVLEDLRMGVASVNFILLAAIVLDPAATAGRLAAKRVAATKDTSGHALPHRRALSDGDGVLNTAELDAWRARVAQ